MKATGIVRKLDELGRVVVPISIRRTHEITERDPIEIFVDGETIILEKYKPMCVFCGSKDDVSEHKGKSICVECRTELAQV